MFTLLLRLKRRIKKLLKVQTESRQSYVPTARSRTVKVLIMVATAVSIGVLYPGDVLYDPLDMPHRGEFAPEDIVAPVQITLYKSDSEIEDERQQVRQFTSYVLDVDTVAVEQAIGSLHRFADLIKRLLPGDTAVETSHFNQLVDSVAQRFPMLSRRAIEKSLSPASDIAAVRDRLELILRNQIYRVGVMNSRAELPESRNRSVLVRRGDRENIYRRAQILDMDQAPAMLLTALNEAVASEGIDSEYYYLIGRNFLLPNLRVNMEEYNRRVNEELQLLSRVKEIVEEGDVIVSARQKVNQRQEEILQEMAGILRSRAAGQGWITSLIPALARIILVLAAFTALLLFLKMFRSDVYRSNPRLLALFLVFALQVSLIYVMGLLGLKSIYIYPVALLPVLVTILFDAEVGVLSTIILALLLGIMHRFSFSLALLTAVVGVAGCLTSRTVRKRSQFYRILLSVVLAYVLLILFVENLKLSPNTEIVNELLYGMVGGAVSLFVVMGVLPLFESFFGMTTDTTLLELSDLNHPLLKRLAIEAPGTYHHSLSVGGLCEKAAEAIGGNSLLARVGAYYHDIGKIEIPEYFVENQFSVKSKHDSITPSMSSLILSSHVKKGRLLGEEADIPDVVLNFIEEHHGTMVQTFFYHRAKEQAGVGGEVDMDKFRYPGPKPQIRETGIAMLADAVEAASRTLENPKPARIDSLIQKIINDRFQSGELDECPLTLRDLAKIKEAFAQVLVAAFHHRVKYPSEQQA